MIRPARRPWKRRIADVVLTLAAWGGAVCILLVPLALVCDVGIVMFRTGSMAPTINPGDVAIVRGIAAEHVEVGDVLTVNRDAALPITHRVTSVTPGDTDAERLVTMRGDANDIDDAEPYAIAHTQRVMFTIPGIAHGVAAFSDARVLGAATLALTFVVGWAFWPRGPVDGADEDADATAAPR